MSFCISRGERVAISGPSGCGKSTLLYLLNRLYPLNSDGVVEGELLLFGKPAEKYLPGEINHRVATVFQDPDSQFCMPTVEEELAFTLENLHVAREEMEQRISGVLELTGLEAYRYTLIQSLSGGMKQRIATACALAMKPEVLLLDEPISHLDPVTAKHFISWLDALQKRFALTIIAVEHRLAAWGSFFDRHISLDATGKVLKDGDFLPVPPILFPKRAAAPQAEAALTAKNLSVTIKNKVLLKDVSFGAKRGEVIVVAGPNGSGKSSLLKALCGIYKLSSGTVESPGAGYVPQSPEFLFLTQSVQEELAFFGKTALADLSGLAQRLQLESLLDAHPFAVSHGQKRRIAIGAMLADRRPVLLMDEPTSGQDAAALMELFELIDERSKEGNAFFIVTHDMEFAAAMADSVILIKDGKLTGKFAAADVWNDARMLASHHLEPPKGVVDRAASFA
ncbi:ABC transporter ATP-binding protein [Planococcus sp. YIM B11945]|uniref:ABC transporter ATP-binding protein n=1 Tax=Planococcus sp. YIM B11945 TaxID=3435410 RepID=UPI003D7E78C4